MDLIQEHLSQRQPASVQRRWTALKKKEKPTNLKATYKYTNVYRSVARVGRNIARSLESSAPPRANESVSNPYLSYPHPPNPLYHGVCSPVGQGVTSQDATLDIHHARQLSCPPSPPLLPPQTRLDQLHPTLPLPTACQPASHLPLGPSTTAASHFWVPSIPDQGRGRWGTGSACRVGCRLPPIGKK